MLTDRLDIPFSGKAKFCGSHRRWDYEVALFVGAPLQFLTVVGESVACDSLRIKRTNGTESVSEQRSCDLRSGLKHRAEKHIMETYVWAELCCAGFVVKIEMES